MNDNLPPVDRSKELSIIVTLSYRKLVLPFSDQNLKTAAQIVEASIYDDTYTDEGFVYHRMDETATLEVKPVVIERGPTLEQYRERQSQKLEQEQPEAENDVEELEAAE